MENVIEWLTGQDEATVTFTQKKFINRIMQMNKKGYVTKLIQNEDGSICAHIPLKAIHLFVQEWNGKGNLYE